MTSFLAATLFPLLLIIAAAGDALTMRIPNRLNTVVAGCFFPVALMAGMPLSMLGLHLAAGAALLAIGFVLFSLRLFGGGDAKLLAAAGLWLGYPAAMKFLVFTVLTGGLLAMAVGGWAFIRMHSDIHDGALSRKLGFLKPDLPYGVALAAGGILAYSQSWWMAIACG